MLSLGDQYRSAVIGSGATQAVIVELLDYSQGLNDFSVLLGNGNSDYGVIEAALDTIGSILLGNSIEVQTVVNAGVLVKLLPLLSHHATKVKKSACWCLSNIACEPTQIGAVIESNVVPAIVRILSDENAPTKLKEEAAWTFSKMSNNKNGTKDQLMYLISNGCIPALCDLLLHQNLNLVSLALQSLEDLLIRGQGGQTLRNTREFHQNLCVQLIVEHSQHSSALKIFWSNTPNLPKHLQLLVQKNLLTTMSVTTFNCESQRHIKDPTFWMRRFVLEKEELSCNTFEFGCMPGWPHASTIEESSRLQLHRVLIDLKSILPIMYEHLSFRKLFIEYIFGEKIPEMCGVTFVRVMKKKGRRRSESPVGVADVLSLEEKV